MKNWEKIVWLLKMSPYTVVEEEMVMQIDPQEPYKK